ncbi:MAG: hypothetical protein JXQ73_22805 [Phycisphaerae bacterium]|nr:hypothetical protein [Phycisphaerae bacterium]
MRNVAVLSLIALAAMSPPAARAERPLWEFPDDDKSRQAICPAWAFEMWMWEDDKNTAEAVWDYVDGCKEHDIPLRVVLIDSPWSTAYNDFLWDTKRYPEPKKMIDELHRRGLKLALWMTCMVNPNEYKDDCLGSPTDFYQEAKAKGYLCNNGRIQKWWKGRGAFIDYTNPEALAWWHGLMDRVLLQGVDGWKVDGAGELFFPVGGQGHKGPISWQEYVDMFYRDCYRHLMQRNPNGVTMVRSVDAGQAGYGGRHAPRDAAPVTWVGDQKKEWKGRGLALALESAFRAMKKDYSVIGSDIGAFSGGNNKKIDRTLFLRWMQWSTFMPFFLNGGHGDHRPWEYDAAFLDIFRRCAWIHHELSPYFYSLVRRANQGGPGMLKVLPGKWQYMLGEGLLVAVIHEPERERRVKLPEGRWIDYWDNSSIHVGPKVIDLEVPDDRYPVFIRNGSIVPLNVVNGYAGHGAEGSSGKTTLDVYPDADRPAAFELWSESGKVTKLMAEMKGETLTVGISGGEPRGYVLRILTSRKPAGVSVDGKPAPEGSWRYDASDGRFWMTIDKTSEAKMVLSLGPE